MRQAWSQQHWRSPMLREDAAHSETHLTLTMESLLPEAKQPSSRRDLQGALKLRHEEHFRLVYLLPALAAGLIEMTIPDKPTSRLQKYRLTDTGRQLLERF